MNTRNLGNCVVKADNNKYYIEFPDGTTYHIKKAEYNILIALLDSHPSLVTTESLKLHGWGARNYTGDNSLPVAISNLRKLLSILKIEIINEPRKGYKIFIPKETLTYQDNNHIVKISVKNIIKILCIMFSFLLWLEIYELWVSAACVSNEVSQLACELNDEIFIIK
ncbi:winged helix-turn-helix domain-containing protein [Vibrio mediterranei]|uniref:OmpR/PhoB-type domain-containing protein n=1 Tax=Vibrio mediterranei TaxID=689 RepID=A0AAN1FL65_9VIBR|nr:helix-turn-helix domain-containing protein [Vibrio mediterranei]ASI92614.1 hypothetical protein BSZ05_22830 [Vibrio mediterranei]